jgi:hypothetical protein
MPDAPMPDAISQIQFLHVLLLFAAVLMILLAPLVPALIIHRLLPNNKIDLTGPLNGLTVKAGGGIASYISIFLLFSAISLTNLFPAIDRLDDGQWTFSIPFIAQDKAGNKLSLTGGGQLEADSPSDKNPDFRPGLMVGYVATLHVTPVDGRLPSIYLVGKLPGLQLASEPIDLQKYAQSSNSPDRLVSVPMVALRASQ